MRGFSISRSAVAAFTIVCFGATLALPAGPIAAADERTASPGTTIQVRLLDTYGSDRSQIGDEISSELTSALVGDDGRELFPAGTLVLGEVTDVKPKGRAQANGEMEIVFNKLRTIDGREYSIVANLEGASRYTKDSWKRRLYTIGIAIGAGMLISKIFGGTFRRGLLLGAAAGTGYVLYAKGEDIVLPAGTTINLVLEETVSTSYEFVGDDEPAALPETQTTTTTTATTPPPGVEEGETLVILRNGNSQSGDFVSITRQSMIKLNLEYGDLEIPLADVAEIVFASGGSSAAPSNSSDTFYLANGRVLLGGFLGYESGRFVVGTDYGELRIPLEDLVRIVFVQ